MKKTFDAHRDERNWRLDARRRERKGELWGIVDIAVHDIADYAAPEAIVVFDNDKAGTATNRLIVQCGARTTAVPVRFSRNAIWIGERPVIATGDGGIGRVLNAIIDAIEEASAEAA